MEVKGKFITEELEIKRFYLHGIELSSKCPKCGTQASFDHYLSYPKVGIVDKMWWGCRECDSEWEEEYILNITIEQIK